MHLMIGISLLAIGAYFVAGLAHHGKTWWQQMFGTAEAPSPTKPSTAGDDPILSAANTQVYGVLGQRGEAAGKSDEDASPASSSGPAPKVDHAYGTDPGAPNHFLHRRLTVKSIQIFEFEIPPHAFHPELRGRFRSVGSERSPGGGPAVEALLLNDEEFADFANRKPWEPMRALDPASNGEIHWSLDTPAVNPKKYYLMLRNSAEKQGPSIVDADFTAGFE